MKRWLGALLVFFSTIAYSAPAQRPDLIVVVSIDQFPYRYIQRFAPYFCEDGFNRFLHHGANFTHALYPYAGTYTGPGHASLGTGDTPSRSGIVANSWYERVDEKTEYCTEDSRSAPPSSPINLQSDSLGDRLEEKYPGAKVLSVSLKDRAAILMAGRKATAAYWLDPKTWRFTSSSYYRGANQTVLDQYNATLPATVQAHPVWEQSTFIPAADLEKITHDPAALRKYKAAHGTVGIEFPHTVANLDALTYTPFGNGLVLGLAEKLAEAEQIGTGDGSPDLLFVSLSSPDYLGHSFGPDSLEAADSVVRTDRDLASFFDFLDRRFGDRYTLALSSDHGVQSIPEVAADMGRDAGRVRMRNPPKGVTTFGELAKSAPDRVELEKRVAATLGRKITDATPLTSSLIRIFQEPAIYLDWQQVAAQKLDGERVKAAFRKEALKIKGVSAAFTNTQLLASNPEPSALEQAVRLSFRADRSGDVIVTLRAGYIWSSSATGTTHGQPIEADQHVPLMLWGDGIAAASYDQPVAPTDLAKSLGALVGVDAGAPESKTIPCISVTKPDAPPVAADAAGGDVADVLSLVLARLDSDRQIRWVAGERLSDVVLNALQAKRSATRDAELARTLPAGTLRLDELVVDGDTARARIWRGPIVQPAPGQLALSCGEGTIFNFVRTGGVWILSPNIGMIVC